MTATQSAPNQDWFEQNKQYWDGWFNSQRAAMNEQLGIQGPWNDFFKEWQKLVSPPSSETSGTDAFRQFFTHAGQNYINMMGNFCDAAGQSKTPEDAVKTWLCAMQKFFDTAIQSNTQPYDAAAQYKNFMETLTAGTPGWWASAMKNPYTADKSPWQQTGFLLDPFGFYASMPGIGYTREKQEHLNKLYNLWVDYEGATRTYNVEMSKVGMQALQKFNEYLQSPPDDHAPLQSLKDIYAKWVDISEEVYARYAVSDEYTAMYGKVVNALMAYKKQLHILIDDAIEQMNLPTRQEIDSLHQHVQELRREHAKLRGKVIKTAPKTAAAQPAKATAPAKTKMKTKAKTKTAPVKAAAKPASKGKKK